MGQRKEAGDSELREIGIPSRTDQLPLNGSPAPLGLTSQHEEQGEGPQRGYGSGEGSPKLCEGKFSLPAETGGLPIPKGVVVAQSDLELCALLVREKKAPGAFSRIRPLT